MLMNKNIGAQADICPNHRTGQRFNRHTSRPPLSLWFSLSFSLLQNKMNCYGVHPFYMGLETTTDAHGVLLLNSNAMGERWDPQTQSRAHTCTALHRVRRQTFHSHTHVHIIPLNYMCSEHLCINEWRPFPCFEHMSFDRMCYIRATQSIEQFLLISNFCVMYSHNEDTFLRIQNCFKSNIFRKHYFIKRIVLYRMIASPLNTALLMYNTC